MGNLTISDIAELAGVGIATVSRALNGNENVSEKTRKKIEKVIREYEYVPSAAAQNLSRQTSDTIGVIIPEADNPFFASILKGLTLAADKNDLTLMLCNTDNSPNKDLRSLQLMKSQRVGGLIFTPAAEYDGEPVGDEIIRHLKLLSCPIVVIDRVVNGFECDTLTSSNFRGAYDATEVLIRAGHKRLVAIAGDMSLHIARARLNGFKHALADHHLKFDDKCVIYGEFNTGITYTRVKEYLQACPLPAAFFVSNNLESRGFFRAVSELGLRIPEDVAYIGFDDVAGVNLFGNKYSYMDRDVVGMGQRAMQMLLRRIKEPEMLVEHQYVLMTPKLYGSEKLVCEDPGL